MDTIKNRLQSPLQKATIGAAVVAVVCFILAVLLVVAAVRVESQRKLLARQSVWPTVIIFTGAAVFLAQSAMAIGISVYADRISRGINDVFTKTARSVMLAVTGIDFARVFIDNARLQTQTNENQTAGEEATAAGNGTSFSEVKNLFRDSDVATMKAISNLDLHKYEDVKAWSGRILDRVRDGSMPCDGSWSKQQIELFEKWIANGMPQ